MSQRSGYRLYNGILDEKLLPKELAFDREDPDWHNDLASGHPRSTDFESGHHLLEECGNLDEAVLKHSTSCNPERQSLQDEARQSWRDRASLLLCKSQRDDFQSHEQVLIRASSDGIMYGLQSSAAALPPKPSISHPPLPTTTPPQPTLLSRLPFMKTTRPYTPPLDSESPGISSKDFKKVSKLDAQSGGHREPPCRSQAELQKEYRSRLLRDDEFSSSLSSWNSATSSSSRAEIEQNWAQQPSEQTRRQEHTPYPTVIWVPDSHHFDSGGHTEPPCRSHAELQKEYRNRLLRDDEFSSSLSSWDSASSSSSRAEIEQNWAQQSSEQTRRQGHTPYPTVTWVPDSHNFDSTKEEKKTTRHHHRTKDEKGNGILQSGEALRGKAMVDEDTRLSSRNDVHVPAAFYFCHCYDNLEPSQHSCLDMMFSRLPHPMPSRKRHEINKHTTAIASEAAAPASFSKRGRGLSSRSPKSVTDQINGGAKCQEDEFMIEPNMSHLELLELKQELDLLQEWAETSVHSKIAPAPKSNTKRGVRFTHPIVTAVIHRPKTKPEDISQLYFEEEELWQLEQDRASCNQQDQFEMVAAKRNDGRTVVLVRYPRKYMGASKSNVG